MPNFNPSYQRFHERLALYAAHVAAIEQTQAEAGWVNPRYTVMCPRPLVELKPLPYYAGAVLQGHNHVTLILPTPSHATLQGVYHVCFA